MLLACYRPVTGVFKCVTDVLQAYLRRVIGVLQVLQVCYCRDTAVLLPCYRRRTCDGMSQNRGLGTVSQSVPRSVSSSVTVSSPLSSAGPAACGSTNSIDSSRSALTSNGPVLNRTEPNQTDKHREATYSVKYCLLHDKHVTSFSQDKLQNSFRFLKQIFRQKRTCSCRIRRHICNSWFSFVIQLQGFGEAEHNIIITPHSSLIGRFPAERLTGCLWLVLTVHTILHIRLHGRLFFAGSMHEIKKRHLY